MADEEAVEGSEEHGLEGLVVSSIFFQQPVTIVFPQNLRMTQSEDLGGKVRIGRSDSRSSCRASRPRRKKLPVEKNTGARN